MKEIRLRKDRESNTIEIDRDNLVEEITNIEDFIEVRDDGEFENRAFFLDDCYEWEIGRDNQGCTILVPIER